jgi:hypothetical protein
VTAGVAALTRVEPFADGQEVHPGLEIHVQAGTAAGGKKFFVNNTSAPPLIAGTTGFTFGQAVLVGDPNYDANEVAIIDAGTKYTGTDVEAALQEAATEARLALTTNGNGASLIGIEDAGGYTAANDVEEAIAEFYADATATKGVIDLPPSSWYLLTGAPLAIFADGASAVPGSALVDSKAFGIRWNNNGTLDAIVTAFSVPPNMDITANATLVIQASKTGATLADAVTFDVGAFNQVVTSLHDADADFGGTTGAMTGDAIAKTIQSVSLVLALANLAAYPASVTLSIKPTNGTLSTDDLVIHAVRVVYKRKLVS